MNFKKEHLCASKVNDESKLGFITLARDAAILTMP